MQHFQSGCPSSLFLLKHCRGNDSLSAVATRAASTTQSFKLRPMSGQHPSTDPASFTPDPPADSTQPMQTPNHLAERPEQALPTRPVERGQQSAQSKTGRAVAQAVKDPRPGGQHSDIPPRQHRPQPAALQDVRSQQAAASLSGLPSSTQQQGQDSTHLNLHQSDVWSPLQASAPRQVREVLHCLTRC